MNFSYSIENKENYKLLNLAGSLSIASVETFEKLMGSIIDKNNIIINLENIDAVTSTGLNTLINFSLEAKNYKKRIFLLKPSKQFKFMIEITKSYEVLYVVNSVEEGGMKLKYYTS